MTAPNESTDKIMYIHLYNYAIIENKTVTPRTLSSSYMCISI